ncbi:MAG: helix-turn-helix transcriptional regulator, partial [Clostridia bacterium]|nr:helix-turn-helix transcriptional regulator [Clostridia bacterium]
MINKISKNIKKLRSEHGFTQDKLAEELHVTRQAISS